ncbi:MAG: hypothetical protein ACO1OQ_01425 [Rufibacter sp.]
MTKTIVKLSVRILSFTAGVVIAWLTVGHVREFIRSIYQWSTDNAFQFYGKHIIINLGPLYYLTFGLATLSLWICSKRLEPKKCLALIGLSIIIFLATMVIYGFIDGNLRAASCTRCEDGIVKLHWNDLDYNFITEISMILGITPLLIKTIKRKNLSLTTAKRQSKAGV